MIYFKTNSDKEKAISQLKTFLDEEFQKESLNESNMKNLTSLCVKDVNKFKKKTTYF